MGSRNEVEVDAVEGPRRRETDEVVDVRCVGAKPGTGPCGRSPRWTASRAGDCRQRSSSKEQPHGLHGPGPRFSSTTCARRASRRKTARGRRRSSYRCTTLRRPRVIPANRAVVRTPEGSSRSTAGRGASYGTQGFGRCPLTSTLTTSAPEFGQHEGCRCSRQRTNRTRGRGHRRRQTPGFRSDEPIGPPPLELVRRMAEAAHVDLFVGLPQHRR